MNQEEVLEIFKLRGALLEGHFVLTSGLHSTKYLQCALVLQYPSEAETLAREMVKQLRGQLISTVVSPAIGGLVIGFEVARQLGARFIWTERDAGRMELRRGFSISPAESVLVVEDVITTGGSTIETIETLRAAGASVLGAASIIDRSGGAVQVGVPRIALASLDVPAVSPATCDACAKGIPAIKPGSRKTLW